ncbi:hypothetical protein ABT023_04450 [Micromonospora sp. NPDC002296]|uniref:hypothetical protein n=1 Tax=Micromonospora sp. NPDC002296 TaxID=3154271 RepID=UPI00331CAED2
MTSGSDDAQPTTNDAPAATPEPPARSHRRLLLAAAGGVVAAALAGVLAATVGLTGHDGRPGDAAPAGDSAAAPRPDLTNGPSTTSGPGSAPSVTAPASRPSDPVATPVPGRSFNFQGRPPVPGVDPDAIVSELARRWQLTFVLSDLYGVGTRRSGGRQNKEHGHRQAIVVADQDHRLRTLVCRAGNADGGPLSAEGWRFLDDCVVRAYPAGANRTALASWLDGHLPRGGPATAGGTDLRKEQTVIGDCGVTLEYGPGLVAVEVYGAGSPAQPARESGGQLSS